MDIQELRIGVWMYVKSPITDEQLPCKVVRFGGERNVILAGLTWSTNEDLSGIPLTGEILTKNGWIKMGESYCTPCTFSGLTLERIGKRWKVRWCKNHLRTIFDVHELQNLLWALGKDDSMEL